MEKNETDREIPAKVNANLILRLCNCRNKPKSSGMVQIPISLLFTIGEKIRRISGLKRIVITPPFHEKIEPGT